MLAKLNRCTRIKVGMNSRQTIFFTEICPSTVATKSCSKEAIETKSCRMAETFLGSKGHYNILKSAMTFSIVLPGQSCKELTLMSSLVSITLWLSSNV